MFKNLFKRNKKNSNNSKLYLLTLTKDNKTWTEEVTGDYLTWFVESGKDFDYDFASAVEKK
jgi:hypothetical protein